jgi:hypothetical protein
VECASLPAKPRDGCGPTLRLGVVRGQDTDKDTASRTQAVQRPLVSGVFHRVRVPSVPPIHVNPRSPSGLRPGRGDLPSLRTVSRIASSWTSSHARARESSLASIFSACQRALAARTRAKGSFDLASRTRPSASPSVRHESILDLILEKIENRAEISVRGVADGKLRLQLPLFRPSSPGPVLSGFGRKISVVSPVAFRNSTIVLAISCCLFSVMGSFSLGGSQLVIVDGYRSRLGLPLSNSIWTSRHLSSSQYLNSSRPTGYRRRRSSILVRRMTRPTTFPSTRVSRLI